jgi:bifunctional DNase/RNase
MIKRRLTLAFVLAASIFTSLDATTHNLSADDDLISVQIEALMMNEEKRNILLVLKPQGQTEPKQVLPLVIGIEEGRSIYIAFHKLEPPRPMSHDLMKQIIREYGGAIAGCVITRMERETFFAELRLKKAGRDLIMDSRPSDAIALALRSGTPILVRRDVLDRHGVDPTKPIKEERTLKT